MTPSSNQFALLRDRRFAPLFWTQCFGAGNDNLFKFALTMLVTWQVSVHWLPPTLAGLVIGAAFILPFVLFSATSGQMADQFNKTSLIRATKWLELGIAVTVTWGFVAGQVGLLLFCIFLMGLQSTLFGPVKYAWLPQYLTDRELTGGNGMIEMGTFVAILLGNVAGGLLIAVPTHGPLMAGTACIVLAISGLVAAYRLPASSTREPAPPADRHPNDGARKAIRWNPLTETRDNLALARERPAVFRSLLGIGWLWFFGAVFLSLMPAYAREVLHGSEATASVLLVVFSVGIGAGSLACETLSRRQVEIGLVPIGAAGMTVFAVDLAFASAGLPATFSATAFATWRVLIDLFLLSACAGLFSVPMYALVQLRTPRSHTARVIAAGNIISALLMIGAAGFCGALLTAGLSIPQVFLITGLVSAAVAAYVFLLMPEYLLRFLAWVLSHVVYRMRVTGADQVPAEGPAIIAANHVSFVDAVLLMAASPRPITFVMDHRIFKTPVLGTVFRLARAIPIAPRDEDPETYQRAFARAAQALAEGELLGIFPEGSLTRDGNLQPFKAGIMKILADQPVPVIPVGLRGLWGSYFSRIEAGRAMQRPFRRGLFSRVDLVIGTPIPAAEVSPPLLQARVAQLLSGAIAQ